MEEIIYEKNVNENRYSNLEDAVAFVVAFSPMLYTYGSVSLDEIEIETCSRCHLTKQINDFIAPKSKKTEIERAMLHTWNYGVSIEVRDLLIKNFNDISELDFRPCRNKNKDIVYYQLTPQHIMKPMAEQLHYRKLKPCKKCGNVQYRYKEYKNDKGWEYYYITQIALNDLKSINVTYEHFNMYFPKVVVSRQLYDYLIERYPRMEFNPMYLKN